MSNLDNPRTSIPDADQPADGLLFGLDDRPNLSHTLTAAAQHVLASFVGIITPTLVIAGALDLAAHLPYLISMALIASGLATLIQVKTIGPVGCGLVAVQGTSFAFLSALLAAGFTVRAQGGSDQAVLAMLSGICLLGSLIEVGLSFFIQRLGRLITPLVTGIVITAIGVSLIKVGITDMAGGFGADDFGSYSNLSVGGLVLLIILALNIFGSMWLRLAAILIGMVLGSVVAFAVFDKPFAVVMPDNLITVPIPFKFGIDFDWALFIPVAIIYLLTAIETSGDITANSLFCGLPIRGQAYLRRIRGGVLADGINSALAACLNTFPNTTFGQNNAVIQMTGVASRYVGFYVAALLMLLGFLPFVGAVLQAIPKAVLGGATLVMFGTIAAGGVRILARQDLNRRSMLIMATAFGLGLGVMLVPEVVQQLPSLAQNIVGSGVICAGLTAVIMNALLPEEPVTENANV